MEEEIWWSCTLDKHEPEYSWPPEDYVKGFEANAKVQRLLIKNAVLAPEAIKDEVVVVQIECEGLNNRKVIAPIVAMKGGQDNQLKVDLPIPGPARLKIVAGQGPIYLTGSHCIDFNEQSESGDDEEAKGISDDAEEIKEDLRSTLEENLIENSKVKIIKMEDEQTEGENEVCVKIEFDPKSREVVELLEVEELKEIENDIEESTESKKIIKEKLEIEYDMEIEEKNEVLKASMGDTADVCKIIPIENVYVEMPKTEDLQMNTVQTNKIKKGKSLQDNNIGQKTRENIRGGDKTVKTGNKPDLVHSYLEKQLKTSTPIKREIEKGRVQVPEKRNRKEDMQVKAEKKETYINLEEIPKMKRKSSHEFSSEKNKKAKTSSNSELNPEEVKVKKTKSEPIPGKRESCKSPVKGKSLAHSKENKAIQEVSIEFEINSKAYQAAGSKDQNGIHEQIPKSEEKAVSERGKLSEAIHGSSPGNNNGVKTEEKSSQISKKRASATTLKVSMMIDINELPPEILLKIHQRLNNSALKKAVLVCKWWRDVGQDPGLWECCKVAVYSKEDISNLSIKRLEKIQEIYINPETWVANDWETFFRAANQFSSLKKIDGLDRGINWLPGGLDSVELDLFAKTLAKLEEVNVYGCTYEQIEVLFKEMERSTRVKKFHFGRLDLSQMESGLFARVLSKLENVRLFGGCVTQEQMEAFFSEIMNSKSMKKLELRDNFKDLEPGLFARALSTVEDVSLTFLNGGSSNHLEALFSELSDETQVKKLRLNHIDLSEIEPTLLASALSRMEELSLKDNVLSAVQTQALFTQISQRDQMKKLFLGRMNYLWQLDQELLARVMTRLEDLEIGVGAHQHGSGFNTATFFTEMSRNSHLKSLKIYSGNLLDVDPEVLAKAVTPLETLTLSYTRMSKDQLVALFIEMSRSTVIKKIDLDGNISSRSDLSSVEPELFVSALMRREEVRLGGTYITHEQAKAFFTELSQNSHRSHLKNLNLLLGDFTAIDPEVLAKAVTNVKEVCFRNSNLSTEQISSIFAHVLEGEKTLKKLNMLWCGCGVAGVNPEIVRKVKEKLKYELDKISI